MPKISLAGPADLLSVIPFHLGFVPRRSVVVVCLHGKRVGLVARFDVQPESRVGEAVAAHLSTLVRNRPSSVWLMGFEDEAGESQPLSTALRQGLTGAGVEVNDRLVVRDGRWYSIDCSDSCCPAEGRLLPEVADVPAAAEYVALGHSVLPDRDALAALVAPLPEEDPGHAEIEAAIDRWQARYTVCSAFDRLRARGLLIDDLARGGTIGVLDELEKLAELARRGERDGLYDDDLDDAEGFVDLDDSEGFDDLDDEVWAGLGSLSGDDAGVEDGAAVIDLAAARAQRGLDGDGPDTAGQVTPFTGLRAESLRAWGLVLRGEVDGASLAPVLPALVGCLRDLQLRDALVAWLCPGSLPMDALPTSLVLLLETVVGDEVRIAAAGRGVLPDPLRREPPRGGDPSDHRDRRGRRARGPDETAWGDGPRDSAGRTVGLREWEEAAAPHLLRSRLEAVCRATPASHAAPVLAVTGNVAWWQGDGARAGVALDGALDLEPEHRLAALVRRALELGLRGGGSAAGGGEQEQPDRSGSWNSPSSA